MLANEPVEVSSGNAVVEVKPQGVSKGLAVERALAGCAARTRAPTEFVLCIGDDRSDEEMFLTLSAAAASSAPHAPAHVFACTVGQKPSCAPVSGRAGVTAEAKAISPPPLVFSPPSPLPPHPSLIAPLLPRRLHTQTQYYLNDPSEVVDLLTSVLHASSSPTAAGGGGAGGGHPPHHGGPGAAGRGVSFAPAAKPA